MLKYYDTICTECGFTEEQLVNDTSEFKNCSKCNGKMKRIFTSMNFKLLYDPKKDIVSWGNEGYASSQYWKEVKKQRKQGKDVKGANEN